MAMSLAQVDAAYRVVLTTRAAAFEAAYTATNQAGKLAARAIVKNTIDDEDALLQLRATLLQIAALDAPPDAPPVTP